MSDSVLPYVLLSLLSTFLSSLSQVMLKKEAMKPHASVLQEYLNPMVIVAYVVFVGTTLIGVLAYRGLPLSLGPILETTGYIYVTLFGVLLFKEKMNPKKLAALGCIIVGIVVYALG